MGANPVHYDLADRVALQRDCRRQKDQPSAKKEFHPFTARAVEIAALEKARDARPTGRQQKRMDHVKQHPNCWDHFHCDRYDCPAHGRDRVRCWLVSGTRCRSELQGAFLEKMEACLACDVFRSHVESEAMGETFAVIQEQFRDFRRMVEERNRKLEEMAVLDHLSGAFNRRKFDEVLPVEIQLATRYGHGLALVMFDIDHFKQLNDACGHAIGDRALTVVADLTQRRLRDTDSLYRFGGDEFVALLPQTTVSGAMVLAEDLRQRIARQVFDSCATLTASFGVVSIRENDDQITLVQRADRALYRAKTAGRNRVEQDVIAV